MIKKEASMVKKILVAFDGSEQSYQAFDFALDMSKNVPRSSCHYHRTVGSAASGTYRYCRDGRHD